uniref:Uncharacterized protein n=1 Tax=Macaca mulatta TaxID=9544 RepID=A0A5F8AF28_MACMU
CQCYRFGLVWFGFEAGSLAQAGVQWHDHGSLQLDLPGTGDLPASASFVVGTTVTHYHTRLIFLFFVEMGVSLLLRLVSWLGSSDPLVSASQSAGITGMSYCPCEDFKTYLKINGQ